MKVKVSTEFSIAYKTFMKNLRDASKTEYDAYTVTTSSSGNEQVGSKMRTITRTAEENKEILVQHITGRSTGGGTVPPRNPVFLTRNEITACNAKALKILGSTIDPKKDYIRLVNFFAERMTFYIKKHVEEGTMEDGPVAPLKTNYARLKKYLYEDVPVLVRTGAMLKGIVPKVK